MHNHGHVVLSYYTTCLSDGLQRQTVTYFFWLEYIFESLRDISMIASLSYKEKTHL